MKTIPAQLLTHLALGVTTTCLLVKVECVGAYAGTVFAFTNLDIDVTYDDGDGALLYQSDNGFTPKRVAYTSGTGIDNSEIDGVIAATGITEQQVRAGIFRSAKVTHYRVNYNDLTTGRHEVVAYGRAGRTVFNESGWTTEFRSLSQILRQPIGQLYSLACNAQFGDTRCGKALTWGASGTVTSVGVENDRVFTDTGRTEIDGYYADNGGIVEWLTGDNAGIEMEVDSFSSDTFTLLMGLPYAIQVGDTYRPRRDCFKRYAADCVAVHANGTRFRGFPLMPVDGTAMVPGAEIDR